MKRRENDRNICPKPIVVRVKELDAIVYISGIEGREYATGGGVRWRRSRLCSTRSHVLSCSSDLPSIVAVPTLMIWTTHGRAAVVRGVGWPKDDTVACTILLLVNLFLTKKMKLQVCVVIPSTCTIHHKQLAKAIRSTIWMVMASAGQGSHEW